VLSLTSIYIGRFICIVALDSNGNAKVGHNQAVPTSELLANCRRQTQTPQVNTPEKFILGVTRRPRVTLRFPIQKAAYTFIAIRNLA